MNARPAIRLCPVCRRPRVAELAPFCSTRCRDRDLANWFNEGYAVPGPAAGENDIVTEE